MGSTRIVIMGAAGRMGRALLRAAASHNGVEVVAALVRPGSNLDGEPLGNGLIRRGDSLEFSSALDPDIDAEVLLDFSSPSGMLSAMALARARGLAFVSGTTGLANEHLAALRQVSLEIPVLWAASFSLGIALLKRLAVEAARAAGPDFDIEIIEAHHRHKIDAPSGTALALGRALAEARGQNFDQVARFGRERVGGKRGKEEIGFSSIRGGDIVGEHTVMIAGEGERLELTHRAGTRAVFVAGALRCAHWVSKQPAGFYDIGDVFA
jgi:4-hydroxy-tetrahydrodipicolinate reductase